MKATALKKTLVVCIKNNRPVLIKGAPGVGKSDIVEQACKEAGAEMLLTHPVVSDPTDYKGLPGIINGKAEFLPFGDLRKLIEAKKPTVCFMDDLGQAPAVVQAAAMQLILARRVNGHKVSQHVTFIAATNRREDRAGVTGILEPVKSRFHTILELQPTVDDWCAWAVENKVPVEMIAFIRFRPELLMATGSPTNDIVNRPCPRTITNAARLFGDGLDDMEVIAGSVGTGFAAEFVGFVKVWQALPSIDGILLNPEAADVPSSPAALWAVTMALVSRVTKDNASRVVRYASRLPKEFGVLCLRDCLRKCPQAASSREFIKWATDNQDFLV